MVPLVTSWLHHPFSLRGHVDNPAFVCHLLRLDSSDAPGFPPSLARDGGSTMIPVMP